MPGFKRPSLPPGSMRELVTALHELHLAAGYPSARELRQEIGGAGVASHTSIYNLFTKPRVPSWGLVELVVEAMAREARLDEAAEIERFKTLWDRAARALGGPAAEAVASASVATSVAIVQDEPGAGQDETGPLSKPLSELLPSALDEWEAVGTYGRSGRRSLRPYRIPTGFAELDALLGGWSPGCLIVIGGRPSSGKTTLLLNFCRTASIKYAITSMFISGEMSSTELQTRILAAEARVPLHSIRTGQMGEQEWMRLARTMSAVADAPIHIATPPGFRTDQISRDSARLAEESALELLLIDSLQWITAHAGSHTSSVEASLWELKNLASTLKLPIVVSAQAERQPEKFPVEGSIQRLRDSSAIERVADVVIILDRPDQDDLEHPRLGEADLVVAKNRSGLTATVTLANQYHYCRFVDFAQTPTRND